MLVIIASACSTVFACVVDTLFVCCVRDKAEYQCTWMSDRLRLAFDFDRRVKKKGMGGKKGKADDEAAEPPKSSASS